MKELEFLEFSKNYDIRKTMISQSFHSFIVSELKMIFTKFLANAQRASTTNFSSCGSTTPFRLTHFKPMVFFYNLFF